MPKATALYDSKPERKGHARLRAQHRSFIIISIINNFAKRAPTFLFLTGRTWKSNTLPLREQTYDNHRRHSGPTRSTGASSTREHEPGATTTPCAASTTTGPSGASGSTSHRCGTACSTRTATAGSASTSSTSCFRFGTGTLPYRPGLRQPQHRGHCNETLQQGHCAPRRKIRWGGGQLGRVPGQCARQGTTVQLASPYHGANRQWDDEKLTHPLQASVFGEHQGTCNDLRQHAYA